MRLRAGRPIALACLALWHALPAWGAGTASAPEDGAAFEPAIVGVVVNGTARGDLFIHRAPTGRLVLRRQDLPGIGLELATPTVVLIDGAEHVALDGVAGIALSLDEPTLTLTITAEPRLLARTVIEVRPPPRSLERLAGEGAFLNWAVGQALDSGSMRSPASLALEAGARLGPALLLSRGQTVTDDRGNAHFVRLTTSLTRDLPARTARWTFGDLVTSPDELGQGVLLGGVSFGTLARLDPYQVRHPLGRVQGQAWLPSEVEVYVDGQRVRTERVPAGVFEIRDLHTQLGARAVQVVVRDPYGRVQRFDQSLYTSQRLLAPGMHDFQYAVGGLRQRFGQDSFDYGSPAVFARHAWGAGPALTLGLRAEGRQGFAGGGASLGLRIGAGGLLSASVARSQAGEARGQAGLLRYEYQSAAGGLGVTWRANSAGYTLPGEPWMTGPRRHEAQVHASRSVGEGRSLWASHALTGGRLGPAVTRGRNTSIGYAAFVRPWGGSLRLTASRLDEGRGARHELSASLIFVLDGGGLASTQVRRGPNGASQSIQWSRPARAFEGWSYDLGASREGSPKGQALNLHGSAQLDASAIRLRAEMAGDPRNHQHSLRLSAAGAISHLGGQVHRSRPVEDAFALVQVADLAGVAVTVNGVPAGLTDTQGRRFIAHVSAHHETVFEIDARSVPIDRSMSGLQRRVVVPERSGALIRFEARRLRALAAQLVMQARDGPHPLARARVWIGKGSQSVQTTTGLQGELYLENLAPGAHHGIAEIGPDSCRFDLLVPVTDDVLAELGTLACTPLAGDQNRSDGPR